METEEYLKQIPVIIYPSGEPPTLDLTRFSIPFSEICERQKPQFIYSGYEKIKFEDRHPEYKRILIQEFLE
jgi:hypothetical protein